MDESGEHVEPEWVMGWGKRRHIPHPHLTDALGRKRGLCGAFGGNRRANTEWRKTCQHCLRVHAANGRSEQQ